MLFGKASFPNFENLNKNNIQVHPEAPTNGPIPSQFNPHKKCVRLSVGGDQLSRRRLRGQHHLHLQPVSRALQARIGGQNERMDEARYLMIADRWAISRTTSCARSNSGWVMHETGNRSSASTASRKGASCSLA